MQFISPNNKVVSVVITPTSGTSQASYTFPTQQDLENRKIVAIESFCSLDISNDPLNPGTSVLQPAQFMSAFLTLYISAVNTKLWYSGKQQPGLFYDKYPLGAFRRAREYTGAGAAVPNTNGIFLIRPTELSFNKCKVEFPTPVVMAATMSAVFVFHYLDKDDDGYSWMSAMGYGTPSTHK